MDQTDRFVSDDNIVRFVDRLRRETNPARQDTLKRLLVEEENRFGATEERLRMVERHLTDGAAHIVRLSCVVAEMKFNGRDAAKAESNLRVSIEIQDLFESFRSTIFSGADKRRGGV